MSDIFEEISQDIKKEKLLGFWKKYQKKISSLLTFVLVAGAILSYWQYRQKEILAEASVDYFTSVSLLSHGYPERALKNLETIPQKSDHAYVELAGLLGAGLLVDQGDVPGAIAAYTALIKKSSSLIFKHLAILKMSYAKLSLGQTDAVLVDLQPLLHAENPWYFLAMEVKGMALMEQKKIPEARAAFKALQEAGGASETLKMRASFFLSQLRK